MRVSRWIKVIVLGTTLLIFVGVLQTASAAKVTGKYATLVVDANTGNILHAYKERELRYPASLTKMMTLYMVFERIENGQLSYNTQIVASREAASRPPSKIGLKPGDRITVLQAVKALVTKSANDVAAAVAEHIAGSEPAFGRLMTKKARQLGMTQTVFRNASGLPDKNQVTTARDMAQLALRLRDHFPKHYRLFRTRVFSYKGRKFKNHNALLGRYGGVDGIKTGYTRASGFNLVTSLRRNGRNIVAVVMGGRSSKARNTTMRGLLAKHVKSGSTIVTRQPDTKFALHQAPKRAVPATHRVAQSFNDISPLRPVAVPPRLPKIEPVTPSSRSSGPKIQIARVRSVDVITDKKKVVNQPSQTSLGQTSPGQISPGLDFARSTLLGKHAPSYSPQRPVTAGGLSSATSDSGIGITEKTGHQASVQVGAFSTPTEARRQLADVLAKAGDLLAGSKPLAIRARSGQREIYRARFAGYTSERAASACRQLKRMGIKCFVVRSQ